MYKKICITNRHLCSGDFLKKVRDIAKSDVYGIILREKDLSAAEYERLALNIISICRSRSKICILHSFTDIALKLKHPYIHLTMNDLMAMSAADRSRFDMIGASAHSVADAVTAQKSGADYITASHIFPTKSKETLNPRGLDFLEKVCAAVDIPVYALGGIHADNIDECIRCGAAGVCMMSEYMNKNFSNV